jgi:hypothetical protein
MSCAISASTELAMGTLAALASTAHAWSALISWALAWSAFALVAAALTEIDASEARALVIVGRVLGVLNIEKHVQALDLANQTDTIKEAYLRILPDTVDQTAFFRSKGWTTSSMGA